MGQNHRKKRGNPTSQETRVSEQAHPLCAEKSPQNALIIERGIPLFREQM
jgi:hypothetical protein